MSLREASFLGSVLWLALVAVIAPSAIVLTATVHRSRPHMLASRALEIFHPAIVPVVVIATVLNLITTTGLPVRVFDLVDGLAFLGMNWLFDAFAPCSTCRTGLWKRAWCWLWRPASVPQHSF